MSYTGLAGPLPRDPITGALLVSGQSIEAQYAERTTNDVARGPAVEDIAGLSITFTPTTSQVLLLMDLPLFTKNVSAGYVVGFITDPGGTAVGRKLCPTVAAGSFGGLLVIAKKTGLTPGVAVTFKGRIQCLADTVTLTGAADVRPFLQALAL